jgi:hypothetical protein
MLRSSGVVNGTNIQHWEFTAHFRLKKYHSGPLLIKESSMIFHLSR